MKKYIALEGPIGVGKSSLARKLAERFGVEPILEQVGENPFLENFYEDRAAYAFQTQLFFLVSRYKQLSRLAQVDIFNQTVVADYIMERDLLFAQLNLDDDEFRLYMEVYNSLVKSVPEPDLTVYLQADTSTLMRRVHRRARKAENHMTEDYVDRVNQTFNQFFFRHCPGPLLIVNTNHIDFVNNQQDFNTLVAKLEGEVEGREYFNPPGSVF
ncbi:MAG: deoxynucleoside kinase [Nitrospinota bacterium]|nr:deoxynucleoside kinase [Nitrospinota bacterium]MDH5677881.1 deoxynucleoside kinase [Nitrospinota bacterium]MDH5756611.1 deoxynucleoside kinase [Nitrospinota bacterium]